VPVAFYDDFNRADGPPGGSWTVKSGTWSIVGNTLKSTVSGIIQSNTTPVGPNVCCFMTVPAYGGASRYYQFRMRVQADPTYYVGVAFTLNATNIQVAITEATGGAPATLASRTITYSPAVTTYLMASCSGNLISGNVDSGEWLTTRSDATIYQGYNALSTTYSNTVVDDWFQYDLDSGAWTVDAEEVIGQPGYYNVTLHNPSSDWTPGTPGSPIFTCRVGTIGTQEVVDSETAVLVYHMPDVRAVEVFNDPYNGNDFTMILSVPAGLGGDGGSGGGLTETQAATLASLDDYLAAYDVGTSGISGFWLKLGAISVLAGSAWDSSDGSAFGDTIAAILSSTDGLAVIKNRIDLIRSAQDALDGTGGYSLSSVQEVLRGASSRDLTQVYNLIANLAPADSTDVTEILNAIAAIRTANMWSLDSVKTWIEAIETGSNQDVLDELARIRTANNWSLGTLYDLLDAIPTTDYTSTLSDIHGDIAAIPTNPITSLQSVLDAISAVRGTGSPDIAAVMSAIDAIPTNPITSLSDVLTAVSNLATSVSDKYTALLAAINALVSPEPTPTAPVWPGVENVTLGTPVNLGLTFASSQACDGVIISITGDSLARGLYDWGSITQHPRAGYISFVTDDGQYADPEPFSFPSHLVTPRNILHPDGFIGRARAGVTGTVTPWTLATA